MASSDPTFYLHHYERSPYAQKIRAMFGLTGHAWASVLSPMYPPRPNVEPLAGGYRRIPVAQIGADVFCDTALIATEVAALTGHAELAPQIPDPVARALAERAEGDVFFAGITSVAPHRLLGSLLRSAGLMSTIRFVRDRTGMMKGATVRPPRGAEAASLLDAYLSDLNDRLVEGSMLAGDAPTYADFCAYHPIWLTLSVGGAPTLPSYPRVQEWMGRLDTLGQGDRREATADEAFAAATNAEPRPLPGDGQEHELLGHEVAVHPGDYGMIDTRGTLVAVTSERLVVARSTERLGTVHVHFPREGYEISAGEQQV